jgi:hypothetical protein
MVHEPEGTIEQRASNCSFWDVSDVFDGVFGSR